MNWFSIGAALAALSVMLGAFGAHALKTRLDADLLAVFETAVRYQFFHALGLLAVAWAADRFGNGWSQLAGWLMLFGILIFSGSLYLLVLSGIRWLGAITPIGGLAFILGWIALAISAWGSR